MYSMYIYIYGKWEMCNANAIMSNALCFLFWNCGCCGFFTVRGRASVLPVVGAMRGNKDDHLKAGHSARRGPAAQPPDARAW